MAKMICAIDQINNRGEEAFYSALEKYLDDSHVVYWNRELYGREFDFCLLIPEVGIAVIEVKGWQETSVIDVPGGEFITIRTEQGEERSNPRVQARAYRFSVYNYIKTKLGKQPVVFHMVCYPFISNEFYEARQLNLISESQLTFTKEDLVSQDKFLRKLDQAIAFSRSWGIHAFSPLLMNQVRSLFEPTTNIREEIEGVPSLNVQKTPHLLQNYSKLSYIPKSENGWKARIDELADAYNKGCRIYSMVETKEMLEYALEKITGILEAKGLKTDEKGNFELGNSEKKLTPKGLNFSVFNWQTVLVNAIELIGKVPYFCIADGNLEGNDSAKKCLVKLDNHGAFNFSQYQVEHAKTRKNILVKAGAGTGKTFAMILRVSFLCYAEDISPANLADRIVMITFTKDAASNMKDRLKSCFQNYYLLTGMNDYLEMITQVDNMQISTIHSYVRKTIEKLGTVSGYGQDLKVSSGLYQRREILEEVLENYIRKQVSINPQYLTDLGLPVYELRVKLLDFVSTIENKSIDVSQISPEQFGTVNDNEQLHQLIISVICETEQKFDRKMLEENKVFLGRLMAILSNLIEKCPERLQENLSFGSRYMFIDEFQDTDDIQISVLQKICKHVGYSMFVVGDIKQCIYRFRGAEEKAFDHLRIRDVPELWDEFALCQNYRTDSSLLTLYQDVFSIWGSPDKKFLVYDSQVDKLSSQLSFNVNEPINSYFHCIPITNESYRLSELFNEISCYSDAITKLLSSGRNLSKEERTIAILVRENWQAEKIVKYGRDKGFPPIQTTTGGELFRSAPALEMCALLQALLFNKPEHLSQLLQSSFFRTYPDKQIVYDLKPSHGTRNGSHDRQVEYFTRLMDEMLSLTANKGDYKNWTSVLQSLRIAPVLQVIRRLYNQLRPWLRFGEQQQWMRTYYRLNVDLLFEKILKECGVDNLTLNRLVKFMLLNIATGRSEECRFPTQGEKDIRILCTTVHKSKGLEYGYVILPFASYAMEKPKRTGMDIIIGLHGDIGYSFQYEDNRVLRNNNYDYAQEAAERLKEETRILYVAMTRAIRAFSWVELRSSRSLSWQALLREGEN